MSDEVLDETIKENALTVCQDYLGGPWNKITISEIGLSQVKGGFSNTMYRCSLPDTAEIDPDVPREVLLRLYGAFQDDPVLLVSGAVTFMLLSERKLGPKLYGLLPKGRLEEFIPSHSLSRDELRLYAPSIARELAKIHVLDVPLKKKPDFFQSFMTEWINELDGVLKEDNGEYVLSLDEYRKEQEWLMREIAKISSPIVFCHNDLVGGNILFREDIPKSESPSLLFIDFELACYNYRGFDLAVHLCEWCMELNTPEYPNFELNLDKFPSKQEQIDFFTIYLEQLCKEGVLLKRPLEEEIESMFSEIILFATVASILWNVWFIKSSLLLNSDLPYREHAKGRMKMYKHFKEQYLQLLTDTNSKQF